MAARCSKLRARVGAERRHRHDSVESQVLGGGDEVGQLGRPRQVERRMRPGSVVSKSTCTEQPSTRPAASAPRSSDRASLARSTLWTASA